MQSGCKGNICGHSASAFSNSVSMPIAALGLSGHCNGYRATVAMICNKFTVKNAQVTDNSRTFEYTRLTCSDITFADDELHAVLRLKQSKADIEH